MKWARFALTLRLVYHTYHFFCKLGKLAIAAVSSLGSYWSCPQAADSLLFSMPSMNRSCIRRWLVYIEIVLIAGGLLGIARWVLSQEEVAGPRTSRLHGRAGSSMLTVFREPRRSS